MFTAIIIDDEPKAIEGLKLLIERFIDDISIVASTTNPAEGIRLINEHKPRILFLDINMPVLNGFQVLQQAEFKGFHLIFTTAHEEHVIQQKEITAAFLLKPIDIDDLESIMNKLRKQRGPGQ